MVDRLLVLFGVVRKVGPDTFLVCPNPRQPVGGTWVVKHGRCSCQQHGCEHLRLVGKHAKQVA